MALLSVGAALLWFAFRGQDINKLYNDLLNARFGWIALSLLVSIIAHYIRALRWKMLMKPLGYEPKTSTTFYAVMTGYLANLAFPRMGEVSRCGVLVKTDQIPLNSLFGTVITERIIDVIFLLLILVSVIAIEFKVIGDFIYINILSGVISKIMGNTLIIAILAIAMVSTLVTIWFLFKRFKDRLLQIAFIAKVVGFLNGLKEGLTSVLKMQRRGLFIVYSIAIWVCYYLSSYFCFFAIDATSHLSPVIALVVLAIGGLGMSAPVQGGIGAYHWIVSQGLMLFGLSQADGLVYATINHSMQTVSILVVGGISLVLVFLINKKNHQTPLNEQHG